jgi:prepilin-type N-terminal cleavage/methylation domain-containing protein
MNTSFNKRGFTLIELLVVIGLIAVLAGGIGLSLGGGDKSNGLKNAQNIISSLLSGARGQAALSQTDAALVVNVTTTDDNFLRELRIVKKNTGNQWIVAGNPVFLDKGVYLVPSQASGLPLANVLFDTANGAWTDLYSTAYDTADIGPLFYDDLGQNQVSSSKYRILRSFTSLGTTTDGKIILSSAELTGPNQLKFNNPNNVRGVKISKYGVTTLINEAEGFKN